MAGKTAVVFTCAHADPSVGNERFDWLGNLIYDIKPDYVVDLGDFDDMRSLNLYDTKKPASFVSQNYQRDIENGQEGRDRIWHKFKEMRKKRPYRIGFEGNHENRIKRAIGADPRIEGAKYGISFKHLQTDYWYDEYHEYKNSAPSMATHDGVTYAHYISSGNYGAAMSGEHHGFSLLKKRHSSTTVGHSHKRSLFFKDDAYPNPTIGLVAGCFKGGPEAWAGQANLDWWKGVIIKRNIDEGWYDPEFVSMARLKEVYGQGA
jgi:hypothetical protein|tara:strand:+ start:1503 stop:2288 length:786 start_codon:yes stop_codon:yes gene_type:complete